MWFYSSIKVLKLWHIFIWSKNMSFQKLHGPEMTGTFWGILHFSERIGYMFPWKREPKIKVRFSDSLPLVMLLPPTTWPLYLSGGSREAVVGAVMKCWQSRYLINLPFPRNQRSLTLCYMACPERHGIDNQTRALGCSGARGCHGCCCLLHLLASWQPRMFTCSASLPS